MNAPLHIGIIPDGNRRFARRLMENPSKGHELGVSKMKSVFEWCREAGVKIVTFWTLSLDNLDKRPREELDFIFLLARRELDDIVSNPANFIHKNRVRIRCFGNLERLPQELQEKLKGAEKATRGYSDFHMNLAIAYSGRQEMLEAVRKISLQVRDGLDPSLINDPLIRQSLQTNGHPDPDLIIRTGGEKRLSNFLIYQSAYSELAFLDTFWPELTREEFLKTVRDFRSRDRRFGK